LDENETLPASDHETVSLEMPSYAAETVAVQVVDASTSSVEERQAIEVTVGTRQLGQVWRKQSKCKLCPLRTVTPEEQRVSP